MYWMIRDSKGNNYSEAVLLAAGKGCVRLAIRGQQDAVEYRFVYGQWVSEDDEPVELESMIAGSSAEAALMCCEVFPRTRTAGMTDVWLG